MKYQVYFTLFVSFFIITFAFQNCAPPRILSNLECRVNGEVTRSSTLDSSAVEAHSKKSELDCPDMASALGASELSDEELVSHQPSADDHDLYQSISLVQHTFVGGNSIPERTVSGFKDLFDDSKLQSACLMNLQYEGCPAAAEEKPVDLGKYVRLKQSLNGFDSSKRSVSGKNFRVFVPPGAFHVHVRFPTANASMKGVMLARYGNSPVRAYSEIEQVQMRSSSNHTEDLENLMNLGQEVNGVVSSSGISGAPQSSTTQVLDKVVEKGGWLYFKTSQMYGLSNPADVEKLMDPFQFGDDILNSQLDFFFDGKVEIYVLPEYFKRWYKVMSDSNRWDANGDPL
jgi:hypothetical protein